MIGVPGVYREDLCLRDGPALLLRPLLPSDGPALAAAFIGLSPRSRNGRFMGPKHSFTAQEVRELLAADGRDHVALAAWSGDRLVAEARIIRLDGGRAECALAVADHLQRKGLGTVLMTRLRRAASERGIHRVVGYVAAENEPMLRLLRKLGARLSLPSLGVCTAELAAG